jgi:beta-lactamase superfamily II metal-dependent hydrolase
MKRKLLVLSAVVIAAASVVLSAQSRPAKPLEIYVVDVEGGKADLFVAPGGETVLVDTGFAPQGGVNRDVDRIMEVIKAAGVTKLDYLISTHYHVDHVGGLQELVTRIPVTTFMDHGATAEDGLDGHQNEQVRGFQAAYADIYGKAKHVVLKVGDKVPVPGVDWRIVTSAGNVQKTAIVGAPNAGKANPECAGVQRQAEARDPDNGMSVGSLIVFGGFRLLDLADLTRDKEYDMVCPNNPLGTVDMLFASNHGTNNANAPFFVHAIQPRVAIAQNGSGKGASAEMFQALYSSPGFQDVWLTHWSNPGGAEWNPPGAFSANGVDAAAIAAALTAPPRGGGAGRPGGAGGPGGAPVPGAAAPTAPNAGPGAPVPPTGGAAAPTPQGGNVAGPPVGAPAGGPPQGPGAPGAAGQGRGVGGGRGPGQPPHTPAYWLKVTVQPDGTYTVLNTRNNFSRTYTPKARAAAAPAAAPAKK